MSTTTIRRQRCDFCPETVDLEVSESDYGQFRRMEGWTRVELDREVSAEVNDYIVCPAHPHLPLSSVKEKVEAKRQAARDRQGLIDKMMHTRGR